MPITVHILTENKDWILLRAARELLTLPGFDVTINDIGPCDISYSIPYLIRGTGRATVGLFTHLEVARPGDKATAAKAKRFLERTFDYSVTLSKHAAAITERVKKIKVDKIIALASQFHKPITFGVCGHTYKSGRKGEEFVARAVADGFNFLAWGDGWPCRILSNDITHLRDFYEQIDYLVVTSTVEGGPVPVLEAISLGVPVIAPDVGWCWDYPVIKYEIGNYESLRSILVGLTTVPTWDTWRAEHLELFNRIVREKCLQENSKS